MMINNYKKMMFVPLMALIFVSCGPGNDAVDVCECYKEVIKLEENSEIEEKMEECIELLNKYTEKHKEAGTLEDFMKAYNECR